jgi:signal transduction histidine kinase/FixJ family two-component response regulator
MVLSMKNNSQKIKNIFIKKMIYSSITQILVLGVLILLVRNYMDHSQLNTITDDLLIKDQYTIDQIGSYQILGSKYALDLELHNLGDMRKLDSIKFASNIKNETNLKNCKKLSDRNFQLCKMNDNYTGISSVLTGNKSLGYIIASKKYHPVFSVPVTYDLLLILLTVLGTFIFNFAFLFQSIKKKIESNTILLLKFISSENPSENILSQLTIDEYKTVAQKFIAEKNEIDKLQKEKMYYAAIKTVSDQLGHDIRSPLTAINIALASIPTETIRIMIRNALKRIKDMVNNLAIQSNINFLRINQADSDTNSFSELIFVVLDNIVSEKRYEYYKTQINIQLNVSDYSYNCFANINLASFKRVLSNLINNGIEACDSNGCVDISLACDDKHVEIIISDNGRGIPHEILHKVTEQGFSFNKKNGAGLGLSYAKQYIDELNGEITIHSEVNIGTKVILKLLRSTHPHWFCELLTIQPHSTIIVLDDDPSIHDGWNEKLRCIENVTIIHFSNVSDLMQQQIKQMPSILYLVDYELLADKKNGLDVIEELNLSGQAILVTSAFEDITIRNRCEKLGVKIIPKSYVPYIPIHLSADISSSATIVFIDDDESMRIAWMFSAEMAGKTITTYPSFNAFISEMHSYSKDTIIYIDSDLGSGINGELYAKELFDLGFTEIHLATGRPANRFNNMPWIKSIIGKDPPFLSLQETSP